MACDNKGRGDITLRCAERQNALRIGAGSAEQPANAKSESDEQKSGENPARAEYLEHLVDIGQGNQPDQENEAQVGELIEIGLYTRREILESGSHKESDSKREEHQQNERLCDL